MRWLVCVTRLLAVMLIGLGMLRPAHAGSAASIPQNYRITLHPEGQPPVTVYAEEIGRGPPILMLHGLGGSSYTWRNIAPALASTHRIIAIDLRGFGRSDKPFDQIYAPHEHQAVVRAFIRARQLANITVVGHSFGGMLALMLALDHKLEPHRIARIVTLDAPAYPQPVEGGIALLQKPILPYVVMHLVPAELLATLAFWNEKFGFDRITGRDLAIYADPLQDPGGPHALIETARQIIPANFPSLIARYPKLVKPALVIACRHDQVVPASSALRLSRALPNSRLVILDGCDHIPPEQMPEAVVVHLKRFLGR